MFILGFLGRASRRGARGRSFYQWATKKRRYAMLSRMDDQRKYALLFAATILAARKLAQYDKPCPAIEATISNAITMAEKILSKIDAKYPATNA
jgi:hypothetical protein